jgi:hypothetical protein
MCLVVEDKNSLPHSMLVVMVVRTLERYAEWAALEASSLEISVSYTLGALYVPDGSTSPFVLSHFPPSPSLLFVSLNSILKNNFAGFRHCIVQRRQ